MIGATCLCVPACAVLQCIGNRPALAFIHAHTHTHSHTHTHIILTQPHNTTDHLIPRTIRYPLPMPHPSPPRIFKILGMPTSPLLTELLKNFTSAEQDTISKGAPNVSILGRHLGIESGNTRFRDTPSGRILDLLNQLLMMDPKNRVTAANALRHPYLTDSKHNMPSPDNIFLNNTVVYPRRDIGAGDSAGGAGGAGGVGGADGGGEGGGAKSSASAAGTGVGTGAKGVGGSKAGGARGTAAQSASSGGGGGRGSRQGRGAGGGDGGGESKNDAPAARGRRGGASNDSNKGGFRRGGEVSAAKPLGGGRKGRKRGGRAVQMLDIEHQPGQPPPKRPR